MSPAKLPSAILHTPSLYRKLPISPTDKSKRCDSESDGSLFDDSVNHKDANETSSFYFPDAQSISSRDSISADLFRPKSASLREKLPSLTGPIRLRKRRTQKVQGKNVYRNASLKTRRTVKREPKETLDSRLHRNVFTYQHHHQHSHHHTMALPIFPLGMNWPFLHLNDPLIMATLQQQSLNLSMHKPLKTAPSGKWNAMHGKIAHFIQADKNKTRPKSKAKQNGEEKLSSQGNPGTSKPRRPSTSTAKWHPALPRRSEATPSAFASTTSNLEKAFLETQVQDLRNRSLDLLQTVASLRQTLGAPSTL